MSDSEEDTSRDFEGASNAKLGNLFASDRQKASGSSTFKWEPPKKKKELREDKPGSPDPSVNAGEDLVLENIMVQLFQNEQQVGTAMCYLRSKPQASGPPQVSLLFVDRTKRKLLETVLTSSTYWIQTPYDGQQQYVSMQDATGAMWTIQFRKVDEATRFTQTIYTVQHSLSVLEGTLRTTFELLGGSGDVMEEGDLLGIKYKYFKASPYEKCPCLMKVDVPFEEVKEGDTKKVRLGDGKIMAGVADCLREMNKGHRRFLVLPPTKTANGSGMRPDSVGAHDTVCCFLEIAKVKKATPAEEPSSALVIVEQPEPVPVAPYVEPVAVSPAPEPTPQAAVQPTPAPTQPAAAPPAAAPPAAPVDTNTLLTTLLVNQLQGNQPKPEVTSEATDVARGIDRLMVQMGQLYQKLDHIDITRKLEENNEKVEGIFRRVVGKAPSAGYDPLKQGIDRDADMSTVLAELEKRDKKIEELTESYHNALATISNTKEETGYLKNDLQIERDTAIERLKEANERHRLAMVDNDVKARQEKDYATERARKEGKEEGYKLGMAEGEREAFLKQAGGDQDEVFKQLETSREENVQMQQELLNMQKKLGDERKQHDQQVELLNQLISKYEEREEKEKNMTATGTGNGGLPKDEVLLVVTKSLKKIMNNVYFRFEEVLKENEIGHLDTTLVKVVKSSTKEAIAQIKTDLDGMQPPQAPAQEARGFDTAFSEGFPPMPAGLPDFSSSLPPPPPPSGDMPPPPPPQ
eukprot:TRINITY_DN13970_c0_g2_i1.p1 TRINITY_DN13970_c0_g2~~TRINITY_DN13970_c0_g2_i1.p1  ORF type:complete len:748 (+),score=233.23 TRINITY_DN13970_c0_g2_i1:41-2284(+)